MEPPVVPRDRLEGWTLVAEATERPFEAGPVSVTAGTARYERETPPPRPFFFASRLRISPDTGPNPALTRLVESRAREGFRDRLADRRIGDLARRDERRLDVDDPAASPATLTVFHGRCAVDGERVPVEALLAVWEAGEYLLAGGAYPTGDGFEATRQGVLRLVRGVRLPASSDAVDSS
ncbi:hypothetical protein EXE48_10505 [Halorubrum sp. ASP1]|jgi:hypothetical protein|uniref:Uncharacterized protein n=1 Tax=Halorubrum tropicale TaxID=1765655 RepID=A0A0M9ASW3_9EURY|nr:MULTISPECIES: hypothetical protein [Halorubrum]KOX97145.1 hypothetical protein AMR74_06895 [Halorubrum tropicale]TKX60852.1 hypothetical protein EXE48_10505 [Halorubrum sp. ASP1]